MLRNGTDLRGRLSAFANPASAAIARHKRRRFSLLRLFAVLPFVAVTAVLAVGPAPAEINTTAIDLQNIEQPKPQGRWSIAGAQDLLAIVERSGEEGLDPRDYTGDALRSAISAGNAGPALDALANATALRLANDFANGRIGDRQAYDWHLGDRIDMNMLTVGLDDALDTGRLADWLQGLLPDSEQYRALKVAYARTSDPAMRETIRANLERWRWMPRALGDRYIYVNVPSYQLEVMNGGISEATYNVVVGAPKTPTPQLALHAQSVVANPSWTLPPSVLKEGGWRNKGYSVTKNAGGYRVVQAPGPRNALGRIKIDMPNPHAIYLHDTPNKAAFDRESRALSHGCVRVQNIAELAATFADQSALDAALENPERTKVLQLERSIPVYIVYFTAVAGHDGSVRKLPDPYARDGKLVAQLEAMASSSPARMAALQAR